MDIVTLWQVLIVQLKVLMLKKKDTALSRGTNLSQRWSWQTKHRCLWLLEKITVFRVLIGCINPII